MCLREPPDNEKKQQNQKISIAVTKNERSFREIIEDVFERYPSLTLKVKNKILKSMLEIIDENGYMEEADLQNRTEKMISVYL